MKIALINFSGNVGKSTIARELLEPRIKGSQVFSVETINSDGSRDPNARIKGDEFDALAEHLFEVDNAIVDIGSSNIEDVMHFFRRYRGSHEDFDFFVVPVTKQQKQQEDTIETIAALSALGIPANKIRLVFNMTTMGDKLEHHFSPILSYHNAEKKFWLNLDAAIEKTDAFSRANKMGKTVAELVADKTPYRKLFSETSKEDKAKREEITGLIMAQSTAYSAHDNLESVYKILLKK